MYDAINQVLQRLGAALDAAELHGLLCGVGCSACRPDGVAWLEHVLPDDVEARTGENFARYRKILLHLQDHVQTQLTSPTLDFNPLLPTDSEPLGRRSEALGLWCQGFLYGLGLGGLKDTSGYSDNVREFLADVTEFSRITSASAGEAGEAEEEAAYMELFEYLRVGVLTLYEEKNGRTVSQPTVH